MENMKTSDARFDLREETKVQIADALEILGMSVTEEDYDRWMGNDAIKLSLLDKTFNIHFCPETCDLLDSFLKTCVCFLIQLEDLENDPFCADIFKAYSNDLGKRDFLY